MKEYVDDYNTGPKNQALIRFKPDSWTWTRLQSDLKTWVEQWKQKSQFLIPQNPEILKYR